MKNLSKYNSKNNFFVYNLLFCVGLINFFTQKSIIKKTIRKFKNIFVKYINLYNFKFYYKLKYIKFLF